MSNINKKSTIDVLQTVVKVAFWPSTHINRMNLVRSLFFVVIEKPLIKDKF